MRIDPPGIASDHPLAESRLAVRHRSPGRTLRGAKQLPANGPDLARELLIIGRQRDGGGTALRRIRFLLRIVAERSHHHGSLLQSSVEHPFDIGARAQHGPGSSQGPHDSGGRCHQKEEAYP